MNGYICYWQGKKLEVYAETSFQAQKLAEEEFRKVAGRKKVRRYDIDVHLAEKSGEQVVHVASD